MSLRTDWSDDNLLPQKMLAIRYSTEFFEDGYYFRTTRTADKTYSFIGMTREAAEACRLAKIAQYTRKYIRLDSINTRTVDDKVLPGIEEVTECAAEVFARRDHGDSWRVDITVRETDVIGTKEPAEDPAELFEPWANDRTYDETTRDAAFRLDNARILDVPNVGRRTVLQFSWDHEILPDFAIENAAIFFKTSATATEWTRASGTPYQSSLIMLMTAADVTPGTFWKAKYSPFTSHVVISEL